MLGREGREGGAVALVVEVPAVGAADVVDVEDMAVDVVAGDDNAVPKGQVVRMLFLLQLWLMLFLTCSGAGSLPGFGWRYGRHGKREENSVLHEAVSQQRRGLSESSIRGLRDQN